MGSGNRNYAQMVIVGVVASAIGIAGGLLIDWFPPAASTQSGPIDTLWNVLLIVSIPIFVLVAVVVLYAVRWFRVRPGQEHQDGEPIHGNTRLEVVWTAVPAALIAGLVVYAYLVLLDIEKAPADPSKERRVAVQAQQFAWQFRYAEKGADGRPVTSSVLYLPVGEPVEFDIRSSDVLHSFWVPQFRMKIDAVPGITTHYRVTPTRTGSYSAVCAELCGLGHAFMRAPVRVVSRAQFDRWIAQQGKPARPVAGGAVDPKQLFVSGNGTSSPCSACHTLAAAGTTGTTGPNLDKVLAGQGAAAIRRSIVDPNATISPGFTAGIMPQDYGQTLAPAELDALVKYLDKVTK